MKMLLVEDDPTLGEAVMLALRQAGFVVDWARDGVQADNALAGFVYDGMLLDLGLPRREGLEVLRGLRKRGQTLPVLILTARDSVEDRVRGLDAGADDYLLKPFALDELLARLRALLRRAHGKPGDEIRVGAFALQQRRPPGLGRRQAAGVVATRNRSAENPARSRRAGSSQGSDCRSPDGLG
jgi:DNA-binding response OmpR family regulator